MTHTTPDDATASAAANADFVPTGMSHNDFRIGCEFATAAGRWRCTDVGQRTIAAIRTDGKADLTWLNGPPYAVEEYIFDEHDMQGCSPLPADQKLIMLLDRLLLIQSLLDNTRPLIRKEDEHHILAMKQLEAAVVNLYTEVAHTADRTPPQGTVKS